MVEMQRIPNVHHSLPAAWWFHPSLLRFSARPLKNVSRFANRSSVNVIIVYTLDTKIEITWILIWTATVD